ncbi:splicing factor 3A subunit 3 [Fistulifera solaris]|uniref:Splicing factor 3A subunit 3 n=1 Tax=Fistulifera solaris TaxID=1519565 RepID=A0A1Z5K5I4_FISSO|nr:splicing factor 3A subunit 3 [Fistulifera solaris]|eukprot:GAX21520.1 splicing factor 3A subunit 3 [Fistulifera solaris]
MTTEMEDNAAQESTDVIIDNPEEIQRQAMAQATRILEKARCNEAEMEAWTVLGSSLLKVPLGLIKALDPGSEPITTGGVQDALSTIVDLTEEGIASLPPQSDPTAGGQWATTVHRTVQALSVQQMAEQAQHMTANRLLEGAALQKAWSVLKAQPKDPNVWLKLLDERLQALRVYHARHQPLHVEDDSSRPHKRRRWGNPAADGYDLSATIQQRLIGLQNEESVFSPDEVLGKYLDLHAIYIQTQQDGLFSGSETKMGQYIDFLQFLANGLDNTGSHAFPMDEAAKLSNRKKYVRFLTSLQTYLQSFLNRTAPLIDAKAIEMEALKKCNDIWREKGGVPTVWSCKPIEAALAEDNSSGTASSSLDLSQFSTPEELAEAVDGDKLKLELSRLGLKCGGAALDRAKRLFLLRDKKLEELPPSLFAKKSNASSSSMQRIDIARQEFIVQAFLDQLRPTLDASIRRCERQMTQTLAEREREIQEDLYGVPADATKKSGTRGNDDGDSDDDAPIYNPKNVPLDWDGKPIAYWLFKLHGLNHYYPCEICGGESYRGRRNFELHFAEQRHAAGMKSLGIPNTKHFHGVTNIDDAKRLWENLGAKLNQNQFDGAEEEQFEDSHGNILSRTAYEDLARQGLL